MHRSDNIQRIRKRILEITDSGVLQQAANIILNRSLGFLCLSALFSINRKERMKQTILLEDAESLFASSIHFPLEIQDGGIAGSVCLGLFYYLTGQFEKSYNVLVPTAQTSLMHLQKGLWYFLQQPIRIYTEKNRFLNSPQFFVEDVVLRGLFEQLHIHVLVEFDPLVLCAYIMYKIKQTEENAALFELACDNVHRCKTRTNKEIDYLRLNLRDSSGDKTPQDIPCNQCDYFDLIKETKPLNLPKDPRLDNQN